MAKITAIILTKNSEKVIEDCLKSVTFVDEIVIIDDGSTDSTRKIGEKYAVHIIECSEKDFSAKRNKGLHAARNEWILYIDADERVSTELALSVKRSVDAEAMTDKESSGERKSFSAFIVKRKNFYYGNHEWTYVEHILRLFHKDALKEWQGVLHESPMVKGSIGKLNGFLLHYSHQDLSAMVEKTNTWSKIEATERFKLHHPKMQTWRFFRVMFTAFVDSFIRQSGWRAGAVGIIESMYQAFSIFVTYAKLWEMQQ